MKKRVGQKKLHLQHTVTFNSKETIIYYTMLRSLHLKSCYPVKFLIKNIRSLIVSLRRYVKLLE